MTTASAVPVIVNVASCPEHIGPFVAEIVAVGIGSMVTTVCAEPGHPAASNIFTENVSPFTALVIVGV